MKTREVHGHLSMRTELRTQPRPLWRVGLLLLASVGYLYGDAPEHRKVTEVFHVGQVGRVGAAETRETLMALFESVSRAYNEQIRREQQDSPPTFKGERVRVIRRLNEQDENGPLFLVAYEGGPSVMAVRSDARLTPGELSPPLVISEAGQHTIEITRRIRIKDKNQKGPSLEVVDESSNHGVPTFFGIPIGRGGESPSGGSGAGEDGPRYKTVTEQDTLRKFAGIVSTERLGEAPREMTKDLFVQQLKNGEVFTVNRAEQRRCEECGGFKRIISDKPKFRDADGKMACPLCKALGTLNWDVTYRVAW